MDLVSTSAKPTPALDEASFQQLLAAAYVLQQHNDALLAKDPAQAASSDFEKVQKSGSEPLPSECRVCRRPFAADEAFCGQCSMPRVAGAPSENLQSKWASLWYMQQARESTRPGPIQSSQSAPPSEPEIRAPRTDQVPPQSIFHPTPESSPSPVWAKSDSSGPRNSLPRDAKTQDRRESDPEKFDDLSLIDDLAAEPASTSYLLQRTWQSVWLRLRGRYLAWAVSATGLLLLLIVLVVWPSPGNSQLTLFQAAMVKLGLAEAPLRPRVFAGNPNANVWADVHTGLYYCEGSNLYGITPGGHYASQHDAQQDQFEPAERTPCP